MALLVALSKRPKELWQRADLLEEIWPNGFGSDEGLSRLVSLLRKTLASDHGVDGIVTTISKLGYRLDATVDFYDMELSPQPTATSIANDIPNSGTDAATLGTRRRLYGLIAAVCLVAGMVLVWQWQESYSRAETAAQIAIDRSRISMAVLPIESMDGIKERAFLADGMTRDLTAALSQVPNALVAPYSSTRLLAGTKFNSRSPAKDLDVRYVISGAMSVEREQLILRIELTDMTDKRQIWSKRFIRPLDRFFELQEQVVREISTSIFSEIQASEIASVRSRDVFDLSVYELIQKAESERYAYGRESAGRITAYLKHALEIDPDSYSARAQLAIQLAQNVISGFSDHPARDAPLALKYLDEVRAIAPRDPQVLTSTAMVQYYINGDMTHARGLLEQSLAIDPNEPHGAVILGLIKCYSGETDAGLKLIRNSEARAPRDPRYGIWAWFRGACLSVKGDFAGADQALSEAIVRNPNYSAFYYASSNFKCLLGQEAGARAAVKQARRLDDEFDQTDYERIITTAGYPGTPAKSRQEVFSQMRQCLASNKS